VSTIQIRNTKFSISDLSGRLYYEGKSLTINVFKQFYEEDIIEEYGGRSTLKGVPVAKANYWFPEQRSKDDFDENTWGHIIWVNWKGEPRRCVVVKRKDPLEEATIMIKQNKEIADLRIIRRGTFILEVSKEKWTDDFYKVFGKKGSGPSSRTVFLPGVTEDILVTIRIPQEIASMKDLHEKITHQQLEQLLELIKASKEVRGQCERAINIFRKFFTSLHEKHEKALNQYNDCVAELLGLRQGIIGK